MYRAWATARAFGRWPLLVFGGDDIPRVFPTCPLCGGSNATVVHLLSVCPSTASLYLEWTAASDVAVALDANGRVQRLHWQRLKLELFACRVSMLESSALKGDARIKYVGKACRLAAEAHARNVSTVIL